MCLRTPTGDLVPCPLVSAGVTDDVSAPEQPTGDRSAHERAADLAAHRADVLRRTKMRVAQQRARRVHTASRTARKSTTVPTDGSGGSTRERRRVEMILPGFSTRPFELGWRTLVMSPCWVRPPLPSVGPVVVFWRMGGAVWDWSDRATAGRANRAPGTQSAPVELTGGFGIGTQVEVLALVSRMGATLSSCFDEACTRPGIPRRIR